MKRVEILRQEKTESFESFDRRFQNETSLSTVVFVANSEIVGGNENESHFFRLRGYDYTGSVISDEVILYKLVEDLPELILDDDIIVDEAKDAAENEAYHERIISQNSPLGSLENLLSIEERIRLNPIKAKGTPFRVTTVGDFENKSVPTKAEQTLIAMRDMLIEQFPLADGDLRQVISDLKRDKQMITDRKNEEITKLRAEIEGANQTDRLIILEKNRFEWSLKTFPEATPISLLRKLETEIKEIEQNIIDGVNDSIEYADALMCLFDSAGRRGITPLDIINAFDFKLDKNKSREWIKNPDNSYSHKK